MTTAKENKKIGGIARARIAREELIVALQDESHPLFLAKDIDIARKFSVSRHTVYKIRDDYAIPSRIDRLLITLKSMDTTQFTISELSKILHLKYQNVYKIVKDNKLPTKSDVSW
jgi:hypothetical protein